MATRNSEKNFWRVIVVGGHTRSIGKTQLVCDVIRAFPETEWIAGKITQYGHGVCARNGENCDCAPTEHVCALDWETRNDTGTDSARFLAAGAKRAFWLRTKQGYLAEGLPLLRQALAEVASEERESIPQGRFAPWAEAQGLRPGESRAEMSDLKVRPPGERPDFAKASAGKRVASAEGEQQIPRADVALGMTDAGLSCKSAKQALIIESNSVMQFLRPSLYFAVIDPFKEDFKESAQLALDRAHALVLRGEVGGDAPPAPMWMKFPAQLMKEKPSVIQREGEKLPEPLRILVHRMLEAAPGVAI